MAIAYKPFQSILPTKEGERLFYPRVVLTGSVTTDDIAKEIAELSSLTTGDTKNVVDNLVYVLTRHLHASESVMLDGFGSFRPVLKVLKKKGVRSASEVSASQSSLHIRFLPASRRRSDGTLDTRSLVSGARFVRFDPVQGGNSGSGTEGGDNQGGNQGGENQGGNPLG